MKTFRVWASQNGLKTEEHKSINAIKFTSTKTGKYAYYDEYVVINSFTKKSIEEIVKQLA